MNELKLTNSFLSFPQGESDEHYNSQAGASYAGAPVNLVNKTDFKGQLQTSLLRKSKENDEGPVEITYTFSQKNNDYFEATVILTHSNPAIGICSIKGDISSTKKASEKSAAHKAVLLIQADKLKLYYEPDLDGMKSRNSSGISDYSTVKETAQDVGTALKGLFGNNFKAAAPVKTPPPDLSEVSSPVSWSIDTSGNTSNVFGNGSGIPMSKESHLTPKSQFLLSVADVDLRGTELLPLLSRGAPLQSREGDLIVSNFHGLGSDFTHPPRSVMSDILPGFQGDKYSPVIDIKKSERDTGIPNYRKGGGYIAEGDGYGDYDSYLRPSPSPSVITSAYESRSMGRRDISTDLRYCNMEPKGEPTTAGSMMRGPSQNQAYSQGDARYDRGYASMQPKPYGMPPPQVTNRYSGGGTRIADPTDYSQRDPRASLPPPGFMGHYQTRQPPSGQAHSIEMLQRHEASRLSHTMRPHGRNEGSFEEDFMMSMCRSTKTLLEPSLASPDLLAYVYDRAGGGGNTFGSQPTRPPQPFDDNASDSKTRMHSFEDEICGLQSEKKLTDWKGELQTFLARNCKDFPFKIEYNSEERVAGGKFVAKVTITFDNKDEENRVVHGIPAINKKTTERTAAGNHVLPLLPHLGLPRLTEAIVSVK